MQHRVPYLGIWNPASKARSIGASPCESLQRATTGIARKLRREFVSRHSRANGKDHKLFTRPPPRRRGFHSVAMPCIS
ncbi:MAG TPA: hypothetical protein VGG64_13070, partial [Pirellulales bacterium]